MNGSTRGCRIRAASAFTLLLTASGLAAAAEDIRGIRGPRTLPDSWTSPEALTAAVIALLCLACGIWYWSLRAARSPSPSESTLRRLESARALMSPHTAQAFGICASEAIRDYIERRFEVVATRQTTEEFLQALLQNSNAALVRHRASLAQFLQQCDFVKFTGNSLAVDDMESLLQSARGFVLETAELPVA
ncbi:MAG TPA: hypothetical protein VHY19_02555 [Steroidobacteraceae bacterium]|jgi:hypothetical protein|nr:hypothetical protein [Steroidobacteraceae bacterium]